MREIKFRAWYKYGKKMVDLYKITPLAVADHNGTMDGLFLPFDNNMILMQYTGLIDKNGKEIYEGDVVRAIYPNIPIDEYVDLDQTFVVEWENRYPNNSFLGYNLGLFDSIEIIGNIWENPGLISQKTDSTPNRI